MNFLGNQSKNTSRRTSVAAVLTGFVALSPALLLFVIPKMSAHLNSEPIIVENAVALLKTQEEPIVGLPARLKIPSIDVDASFEYVGLAPDGAMDIPKERANVAWFELGKRPGENGSAVIAGHYGWQNKEGSVFDNLHKLRKGDRIYVEDDRGDTISFVVRESRRYDPQADTSAIFGLNDGKAYLNLVTCEGAWDESTQQYSRRLVVFTDREVQQQGLNR